MNLDEVRSRIAAVTERLPLKVVATFGTMCVASTFTICIGYVYYRICWKLPKFGSGNSSGMKDPSWLEEFKNQEVVDKWSKGVAFNPSRFASSDLRWSTYDYIVIGAGIGGLTCASMIARQGYKVLVLEQHDRLGGATHCFDSIRPSKQKSKQALPRAGQLINNSNSSHRGESEAEEEEEEFINDDDSSATTNNGATLCEFDTGYHYTCASFCKPETRPGAFLKYASGGALQFADLGDPYDRLMFPHTSSCRENRVGETEYHFVREDKPYVETLIKQLHCKHPEVEQILRTRLTEFHRGCHKAAHKACSLFMGRCVNPTALQKIPFIGSFLAKKVRAIERVAVDRIDLFGSISTAFALRMMIGEGKSLQETLKIGRERKRAGQESHDEEINGSPPSALPSGWSPDEERSKELVEKATRLMAVLVHPLGDYAAQPRDSSYLAHSFVVNYYRHGSSYPEGPAQALGAGMNRIIVANGGQCLTKATASQVIFDDDSVVVDSSNRRTRNTFTDKKKKPRAIGVEVKKTGSSSPAAGLQSDDAVVGFKAKYGVINAAGIFNALSDGGFCDVSTPSQCNLKKEMGKPRQNTEILNQVETARKTFLEKVKFQPSMGHMYLFVVLDGTPEALNLEKTNYWCFQGRSSANATTSSSSVADSKVSHNNDIDGAFDQFLGEFASNKSSAEERRREYYTTEPKEKENVGASESAKGVPGYMQYPPPTVYITFPCAKVPEAWSRSPSGQRGLSNCILFCDADYRWFEAYKEAKPHQRGAIYQQICDRFAQHMLRTLLEKRPDLKSKILWYEVGSPVTSEHYLGAFRGGDYGTRVDTEYFCKTGCEYLMRADTPGFEALYQAGQDAMTPSISGAMHGGVMCAYYALGPWKAMLGLSLDVMNVQYHALRQGNHSSDGSTTKKRLSRFEALRKVLYNFCIEGDL